MSSRFQTPPSDLSEDGRERWPGLVADVVAVNGRSEVDIRRLAELMRAEDRLAEVRGALNGAVTTKGSTGQVRAHPLLQVEAALARQVAEGYAALRLSADRRPFGVTVDSDGRLKSRGG